MILYKAGPSPASFLTRVGVVESFYFSNQKTDSGNLSPNMGKSGEIMGNNLENRRLSPPAKRLVIIYKKAEFASPGVPIVDIFNDLVCLSFAFSEACDKGTVLSFCHLAIYRSNLSSKLRESIYAIYICSSSEQAWCSVSWL